jgi:hypothetical protein
MMGDAAHDAGGLRRPSTPRSAPSCFRQCLVLLAVVLLASTPAEAQWLGLRGDTLLGASSARPALGASDSRAQVPLYQFLQLEAQDLGVANLQLELSGVAGIHLGDLPLREAGSEGSRVLGEVVTGLLRWQDQKRGISITLGRQYLFAGAGRAEHLDGLALQVRAPWNLDLTVFGGRTTPWQVDYDPGQGAVGPSNEGWAWSSWAVGGRARFRMLERVVAAIGFVHEGQGGETVRQCLSLDAGYWASRRLEILAGAALDTVQWLPQEAWVELISRPRPSLKLTADYSYQVPSLTVPKTSIFSVFSLDSFQEASLGVHYGVTPLLALGVEGGVRLFPSDDGLHVGANVAAQARLAFGAIAGRLAGLRVEFLDADGERLLQGRLYAIYSFDVGVYSSLEVYGLYLASQHPAASRSVFEQRLSDHPLSLGGLGTLGYRITSRLSAQLVGSAFSTPAARSDLRLMARLTYAGSWSWGGAR